MKKKKIIVVVPDGTGIRNYLFSQIIPNLVEQDTEICIYHALSDDAIQEVETLHGIKFNKKSIENYRETIIQKFLREVICYARLHHNAKLEANPTVLTNWKRNHKGVKKWFYKVVEIVGKSIHENYNKILQLEAKYQKELKSSIEKELVFLKDYNPDVLFCTHQRAVNAVPIFKAAEVLGIKTIGAIYSWDNLVKARLTVKTSFYVVWSNYMKEELVKYYPEIEPQSIRVTGTPQFELFNNAKIVSKKSFFNHYNLSEEKFTICFSGDDELTSPYDPSYLGDLVNSINNSPLKDKVQIIFRRCPIDLSGRYDLIVEKNKGLVVPIVPQWSNNQKQWTQLYPFYEDVNLLANICKHSDLVINVGSTMAHDFAIFDKPAAYINYDAVKDKNWSVNTIYNYQHFRSMPNKNVVYWVNTKEDYVTIIDSVVKNKFSLAKEWLAIINDTKIDSQKAITQLLIS